MLLADTSIGVTGSPFLNYSKPIVQIFTFTFEKGARWIARLKKVKITEHEPQTNN